LLPSWATRRKVVRHRRLASYWRRLPIRDPIMALMPRSATSRLTKPIKHGGGSSTETATHTSPVIENYEPISALGGFATIRSGTARPKKRTFIVWPARAESGMASFARECGKADAAGQLPPPKRFRKTEASPLQNSRYSARAKTHQNPQVLRDDAAGRFDVILCDGRNGLANLRSAIWSMR
jgi:hypothetical protein